MASMLDRILRVDPRKISRFCDFEGRVPPLAWRPRKPYRIFIE